MKHDDWLTVSIAGLKELAAKHELKPASISYDIDAGEYRVLCFTPKYDFKVGQAKTITAALFDLANKLNIENNDKTAKIAILREKIKELENENI